MHPDDESESSGASRQAELGGVSKEMGAYIIQPLLTQD
jgi:hypothetical protein